MQRKKSNSKDGDLAFSEGGVSLGKDILSGMARGSARNVPRVSRSEGKSRLRGRADLEGNISPRAILTKDGIKKVDVKTASALLELGSIIDLGKGVFLDADIAASAFGGEVGDEFRYSDIGLDEVGIGIGKKIGDSGQIGLKGTYRPGRGGQDDDYTAGLTFSSKFNKGGAVDMQQMEMFNVGGLKDEGGAKDPVSGNDVPSGSLKEEVRDDIDAKLSPGEFVFPADVTRFLGLRFLMELRDKAKAGLQRMEDMGQMGNSEEAVLDEDVPFEQSDLIIVAGSPMEEQMNKMNIGGMPIRASNGTAVPTTGRGDQLLGSNLRQYFNPTTQEIRSVLVSRDNLTGELKPVSPLEEGFILDTPENRTKAMRPTGTSAKVETARVPTQRDRDIAMRGSSMPGGPARGDIGMTAMTTTERAAMADIPEAMRDPIASAFGFMSRGLVSPGKVKDDFALADKAAATLKAMTPAELAAQMAKDNQKVAERELTQLEESYGAPVGSLGTAVSTTLGNFAVDLDNEIAYSLDDGSSRVGKELKQILDEARAKQEKADDRAEKAVEKYGFDPERASPGALGGSSMGGYGTSDDDKEDAKGDVGDPAETGTGAGTGTTGGGPGGSGPSEAPGIDDSQDDSQAPEEHDGGLIERPKRKKQKKKMKRGGLASR